MKIEDIVTDKDGLKKIIDFLHSEGNFAEFGRAKMGRDAQEYRQAFHLTGAKTERPGSIYMNRQPDIRYLISLDSCESPEPPAEQVNRLFELVKEVYKG